MIENDTCQVTKKAIPHSTPTDYLWSQISLTSGYPPIDVDQNPGCAGMGFEDNRFTDGELIGKFADDSNKNVYMLRSPTYSGLYCAPPGDGARQECCPSITGEEDATTMTIKKGDGDVNNFSCDYPLSPQLYKLNTDYTSNDYGKCVKSDDETAQQWDTCINNIKWICSYKDGIQIPKVKDGNPWSIEGGTKIGATPVSLLDMQKYDPTDKADDKLYSTISEHGEGSADDVTCNSANDMSSYLPDSYYIGLADMPPGGAIAGGEIKRHGEPNSNIYGIEVSGLCMNGDKETTPIGTKYKGNCNGVPASLGKKWEGSCEQIARDGKEYLAYASYGNSKYDSMDCGSDFGTGIDSPALYENKGMCTSESYDKDRKHPFQYVKPCWKFGGKTNEGGQRYIYKCANHPYTYQGFACNSDCWTSDRCCSTGCGIGFFGNNCEEERPWGCLK